MPLLRSITDTLGMHGYRKSFGRPGALIALAVVLGSLLPGRVATTQAAQEEVPEYQVKAVWLLNFAKYIEWPKEAFQKPDSPIIVGILGQDPFGPDLDNLLKQATARDRPFAVKRLQGRQERDGCHILFIAKSEEKRQKTILQDLNHLPILTIGESDAFASDGGIVQFLLVGKKVRFNINLNAANAAKLKIDSRVVGVAHQVIGTNKSENP